MPIKYKVIAKTLPGEPAGGKQKYYPLACPNGETTMDEIVEEIERFSALSDSDIRGTIISLVNVIKGKLCDGKIVRLEGLGSLYPTIISEGNEDAAKVGTTNIKRIKINYRPGRRLNKVVNNAEFKKVSAHPKTR
jgi:predicted histone-like DNA-binding protein